MNEVNIPLVVLKHSAHDCNLSRNIRYFSLLMNVLFSAQLTQIGTTWCKLDRNIGPTTADTSGILVTIVFSPRFHSWWWCNVVQRGKQLKPTLAHWLWRGEVGICIFQSATWLPAYWLAVHAVSGWSSWKPSHIISRRWSLTQSVCLNSCFMLYTRNPLQCERQW